MTWFLKCDSGKSSSEYTQTGAGLETVRGTVPVSNVSGELWVHVILGPGIWNKEVKISSFRNMVMMYSNKIVFDFV